MPMKRIAHFVRIIVLNSFNKQAKQFSHATRTVGNMCDDKGQQQNAQKSEKNTIISKKPTSVRGRSRGM